MKRTPQRQASQSPSGVVRSRVYGGWLEDPSKALADARPCRHIATSAKRRFPRIAKMIPVDKTTSTQSIRFIFSTIQAAFMTDPLVFVGAMQSGSGSMTPQPKGVPPQAVQNASRTRLGALRF